MNEARLERLHHLAVGAAATVSKTLTEADAVLFQAISGEAHPLYQDAVVAGQSEFGGRVLPAAILVGLLSAAMAEIGARVPPPGAVSSRYTLVQVASVRPGDTVTARLTVAAVGAERYEATLRAEVTNQRGELVMNGTNVMKIL